MAGIGLKRLEKGEKKTTTCAPHGESNAVTFSLADAEEVSKSQDSRRKRGNCCWPLPLFFQPGAVRSCAVVVTDDYEMLWISAWVFERKVMPILLRIVIVRLICCSS